MRLKPTPFIVTAGVVAVAGVTFLVPDTLRVRSTVAGGATQERQITGLVRDFKLSHADFGVLPGAGAGHYAGNVEPLLTPDGRPVFAPGDGYRVDTPWEDELGRPIAPHLYENADDDACGNPIVDTAGDAGATDNGAITSSTSFAQWFRDVPGKNLSLAHAITLERDGSGVWAYLEDEFHPVDNRGFGNESEPNNNYFTYHFQATFTYKQCWQQWLELQGGDGAWVFIDGRLAIDLGGVAGSDAQFVALDRLGLTHDQTYTLDFFYAQRQATDAVLRLRTTIDMASTDVPQTVSAAFD